MVYGLPEMIKKLRKARGLSQKALSELIGVSPSIISGYETGERTPSLEILLALSKIFNCSTDVMLGRESPSVCAIETCGLNEKQINAISKLIEAFKDNEK